MYQLTLTYSERQAIDFVGYRYGHGDQLASLLSDCTQELENWTEKGDMKFSIPEHIAWGIKAIAEECNYFWDLFGTAFSTKMTNFCMEIV